MTNSSKVEWETPEVAKLIEKQWARRNAPKPDTGAQGDAVQKDFRIKSP